MKRCDVSRPKKSGVSDVSRCVLKVFNILTRVHIHQYHLKPYKQRDNVSRGKKALSSLFLCVQREFPISYLDTKNGVVYKGNMMKTVIKLLKYKPGHISLIIARFTRIKIDVSKEVLRTQKEA